MNIEYIMVKKKNFKKQEQVNVNTDIKYTRFSKL